VSNIELGYALRRLDDAQGALVAYRRALELREDLLRDDTKNALAPHDLASALWSIGVAENAIGDRATALASFQRAMPLATPPISDRDDLQARIVSGAADAHEGSGRLTEALRTRRQALEQRRALLAGQPSMTTLRRAVATEQKALGATLASLAVREPQPATRQGRWREAHAAYEEGLRVTAGLGSGGKLEPADAALRDDLRQGLARCVAALAEDPR
jgi:tetratricopeptide (TPR) repeat protein